MSTKSTTMTQSAFLATVTAGNRTDADVKRVTEHLKSLDKRATFEQAIWAQTRITSDDVARNDVAAEMGVTGPLVTQLTKPLSAMLDSGIPIPTTVEDAAVFATTYMHVKGVYKSGGSKEVAAHVETVKGYADLAAKHEAWLSLPKPDKSRPARPNDGTGKEDDDKSTDDPQVDESKEIRTATFEEALHMLVSRARTERFPDLERVSRLADDLAAILTERVLGADVDVEQTVAA